MALNKIQLEEKIKTAFEKAKNTPPPEEPDDADQVQVEILQTLSTDLANAIDEFIRSGSVRGVTTNVILDIPSETGTGTQSGNGFID